MAITIASRGRSTKMSDSIALIPLVERWLQRGGAHRRTGVHSLEPLDDDVLAALESGSNDDASACFPCGLDPLYDSLAVLGHEDVDTLLVGDEGVLRHHDLLLNAAA